jgi:hypothetical protein
MQLDSRNDRARPFSHMPVWLLRAAAVATSVVLLALSMPLVWAAVSAGAGLMALAVMAAGGVALFQAVPWAAQRLENQLLKLRKAEARANPIEQLQNEMLRRAERLQAFRRALATVGAQIESITHLLAERRHVDPGHVLQRQERSLQRLTQFHAGNLARLDEAQAALEAFRHQVKQKVVEWEISLAIQDAQEALNPGAADNLLQDMLTDEALRTVQDRFNTVFAELDIQMRAVDAPTHVLFSGAGIERLDALTLPEHHHHDRRPA